MHTLYQSIVWVHIMVSAAGLLLFWFPIVLRKGSTKHKQIGRWFFRCMWYSGITGLLIVSLMYIEPSSARDINDFIDRDDFIVAVNGMRSRADFLMLLSLLLMMAVKRAEWVLTVKHHREALRRPQRLLLPVAMAVATGYVAIIAVQQQSVLFFVFVALSIFLLISYFRYVFKSEIVHGEWMIQHINGALGAGIAAHTAFFVVGANRFISGILQFDLGIIPWILPGVIGGMFIFYLSTSYRRKLTRNSKPQPHSV